MDPRKVQDFRNPSGLSRRWRRRESHHLRIAMARKKGCADAAVFRPKKGCTDEQKGLSPRSPTYFENLEGVPKEGTPSIGEREKVALARDDSDLEGAAPQEDLEEGTGLPTKEKSYTELRNVWARPWADVRAQKRLGVTASRSRRSKLRASPYSLANARPSGFRF
jgi:hypothetical protein